MRVIFIIIVFTLTFCSGKDEYELVYQFPRIDCQTSPETLDENLRKLTENDIEVDRSECLITQDLQTFPICDSNIEANNSNFGGVTLDFNNSDIEGLENLVLSSDFDPLLSFSFDFEGTPMLIHVSNEDLETGGFGASLPNEVLNMNNYVGGNVYPWGVAYIHKIKSKQVSKAEGLGFKAVNTLNGNVEVLPCE